MKGGGYLGWDRLHGWDGMAWDGMDGYFIHMAFVL